MRSHMLKECHIMPPYSIKVYYVIFGLKLTDLAHEETSLVSSLVCAR